MSKRLLWALLLIALSVIVLLVNVNAGAVSIFLLPKIAIGPMSQSVAFLTFMIVGAVIGILLK
ncbi:MAG: hypothetical protein R6V03_06850 [Kiritimatiellia bacterium]